MNYLETAPRLSLSGCLVFVLRNLPGGRGLADPQRLRNPGRGPAGLIRFQNHAPFKRLQRIGQALAYRAFRILLMPEHVFRQFVRLDDAP